jgi:hypothetical protein
MDSNTPLCFLIRQPGCHRDWEGAANGQHDGWLIQAASVGEAEEGTGLDAAGSDFADLFWRPRDLVFI